MAQWGKEDIVDDAPKFTTNSTTGESGKDEYGTAVFALDPTEVELLKGATPPGWVRIVEGTGGRAGRTQYETLVAMKNIIGDAVDPEPGTGE